MAAIDLHRGGRVWDNGIGGTQQPWAAGDFVYLPPWCVHGCKHWA